jgi:hypothetical protein
VGRPRYRTEQAAKKSILDLYADDIAGGGARAQVAIFVPRHELAREVKEVIERNLEALGKLAPALAVCEENGWEALPLAAAKLSELFPELWRTARAVEGWLRKNPLDSSLSIIRLWGVFLDYKPKRQRRWSRALVRNGADAREALAAVLGVPAEQIGMGDLTGL